MRRALPPPFGFMAALARRALWTRDLPAARALAERSARHLQLAATIEHVHGPRRIEAGPDEVIVTSVVRDVASTLRDVLGHHLDALGVRHVVLLDNGSTDETVAIARAFPRVTILRSSLPYRTFKLVMKQYLVYRFGMGRWVLHVDGDELFVHPGFPEVPLSRLIRYLDDRGYTAVLGQMLDMFGEGPLVGPEERAEARIPIQERYPLYDLTALRALPVTEDLAGPDNVVENPALRLHRGGVRDTVFGVDCYLSKFPLFKMDGRVEPMRATSHMIEHARVADISCALLHYKLTDSLRELSARAVREGSYHDGSREYRGYQAALDRTPDLRVRSATARALSHVDQLVEEGFLVTSEAWRAVGELRRR